MHSSITKNYLVRHRCLLVAVFIAVFMALTIVTIYLLTVYFTSSSNPEPIAFDNSYNGMICTRLWLAEKKMACIPNDTITIPTGGRLGNRITQYAAVWSIAKVYGLQPFVPDDIIEILDDVFEGLSIPSISEFLKNKTSCKVLQRQMVIEDIIAQRKDINQRVDSFETVVMKARNTSRIILVEPYSMMGETIVPLASKLHEEFNYKPALVDGAQRSLSRFRDKLLGGGNISRTEQVIFVGIHVRRSDYIPEIALMYQGRQDVGVDYYCRAVHWMRNKLWEETKPMPLNIAFVVSSDDGYWCKTVLIPALTSVDPDKKQKLTLNDNMGKYNVFWGGNCDLTRPEQDLVLLSSCNHSIYAYGSFGLWSALMAGGRTVVFDITGNTRNDYIRRMAPSMVFADHMQNWVLLS